MNADACEKLANASTDHVAKATFRRGIESGCYRKVCYGCVTGRGQILRTHSSRLVLFRTPARSGA
jgi:hypothetical protein